MKILQSPTPGGSACFRSGEIRILDATGNLKSTIELNDVARKL